MLIVFRRALHMSSSMARMSGVFDVGYLSGKRLEEKLEKKFSRLMRQKYGQSLEGINGTMKPEKPIKLHRSLGPKKLATLTEIFAENIQSMLNSGELDNELARAKISVTKAKLAQDCQNIKIFWVCGSQTLPVADLQKKLENSMNDIRTAIQEQNFIGFVPLIEFLPDTSYSKLEELNRLLDEADYGPDHNTEHADFVAEATSITNILDNKSSDKS